jgi:hypothetical protein
VDEFEEVLISDTSAPETSNCNFAVATSVINHSVLLDCTAVGFYGINRGLQLFIGSP